MNVATATAPSVIDTRRAQMFPVLTAGEIDRVRRFAEPQRYAKGKMLFRTGQKGLGISVILDGAVNVTQHNAGRAPELIVTHGPGAFLGELAQLSDRPSLVDAEAASDVDALVVSPDRLRALLIAEADLGERIMRALILRRVGLIEVGGGGPVIVGRADDAYVVQLENFLARNGHPHVRLDPGSDGCAQTLIDRFHVELEDLPIVLCPNGELLRRPPENALARCLGMVSAIDPDRVYDAIIVGAGPAGLAASVYAGSEGLSVLTLDCRAFGGQAGASARIENFLGFPTGISGLALTARAFTQAQKFGVEMAIPDEAGSLDLHEGEPHRHVVVLANGERAAARAIVIATGARYRRLEVPGIEAYEGSHVHFWASPVEGRLCSGQHVMLVGGGNSAGQAAVFLAGKVAKVTMVVRRPLADTMSRYLIDRIKSQPNIELIEGAAPVGVEGSEGSLTAVVCRCSDGEKAVPARHLFLFIGAEPNSDWLDGTGIALDQRGFIRTGGEASHGRLPLETNVRGIFAIGDVRSESVKRVAAAAGDGAQVVASIHQHLAGQ
ncbi:FAD-dependent oxidoreductase [Sphingomonas sp.]|uniref:FAD-dependent oxidoreductase n=1 Tax=Sphingomonas sp. TaxID=28214 RepID=UPI001B0C3E40|nr:FAD-dependent oxidoreductase [Sphingomonas sp.]MBO9714427.1 FAD-dependent oxidoreductase [Sphingomonas sp.]